MSQSYRNGILVLIGIYIGISVCLAGTPERLQIYGKMQVGQGLPSDLRFIFDDSKKESSAQFYAFYFAKSIAPRCDCSLAKKAVAWRGGSLFVIDDKIAPFFAIPYVHNGVEYQLVDSVLINVSNEGRVISIHRDISPVHFVLGFGMPDRFGRSVDTVRYGLNKIFFKVSEILS